MNTHLQTKNETKTAENIGFSCNPPAVLAATKLSWREQVALDNAAYAAATPEQRRVIIAKDALKQLMANAVNVVRGTYLSAHSLGAWWDSYALATLQETLRGDDCPINATECNACAKGTLFLSAVRCGATVKSSNICEGFGDWPKDNWHLIEHAFETRPGVDNVEANTMQYRVSGGSSVCAAKAYGASIEQPRDRLIAILNNIIENNGLFIPPTP